MEGNQIPVNDDFLSSFYENSTEVESVIKFNPINETIQKPYITEIILNPAPVSDVTEVQLVTKSKFNLIADVFSNIQAGDIVIYGSAIIVSGFVFYVAYKYLFCSKLVNELPNIGNSSDHTTNVDNIIQTNSMIDTKNSAETIISLSDEATVRCIYEPIIVNYDSLITAVDHRCMITAVILAITFHVISFRYFKK